MNDRRLLLARTTKILVLIGIAYVIYPLLATLIPGDSIGALRQQHWQREIDLAQLQPGELLSIDDWPGGPVAVYRRSAHELDGLTRIAEQLHDPQSQHSRQPAALQGPTRSHLPAYFVFIPADTDRACQIRHIAPDKQPKPNIAWYGGFTEPCHGSLYDTAGRVYRDYRSERQQNLAVPGYKVIGGDRIQLTNVAR